MGCSVTTRAGVPLAPSLRGVMGHYMAIADFRCGYPGHADAMAHDALCPGCRLTLGDYVRALDVVTWP
jgi:hypothetical protein